jgi:hypothetical protein
MREVAHYIALTSAFLLIGLSICREFNVRLPRPVDRLAEHGGTLDRIVVGLALVALVIFWLWLVKIVD